MGNAAPKPEAGAWPDWDSTRAALTIASKLGSSGTTSTSTVTISLPLITARNNPGDDFSWYF